MTFPFRPSAVTVSIDVSDTSQSVLIGDGPDAIRIVNDGTATAWLSFGDDEVEADAASGFPVGPGVTEVLSPPYQGGSPLYVAAIAEGATGKIYFTPGVGI